MLLALLLTTPSLLQTLPHRLIPIRPTIARAFVSVCSAAMDAPLPAIIDTTSDKEALECDKALTKHELAPTKQILLFAAPVLGACLAEPLLSMIDTMCVGRMTAGSASIALAALGVNSAVFNVGPPRA